MLNYQRVKLVALPKNGCRWASGWWFVLTSGSTDGPGHFHRSKVDLPLGCWHFDLLDEWHAPSCRFAIFCQHLPIHQFTNWAKQGASAFRRGPTAGFSLPGSTDVSKHLRIRSTPLGPAMWWMSWWVRPGRPSPRWRDDLFPQLLSSLYRSSGDKENPNQGRVIWVIWRSSQRWIFGYFYDDTEPVHAIGQVASFPTGCPVWAPPWGHIAQSCPKHELPGTGLSNWVVQWPFQEPKFEVPTIYKAYVRPM